MKFGCSDISFMLKVGIWITCSMKSVLCHISKFWYLNATQVNVVLAKAPNDRTAQNNKLELHGSEEGLRRILNAKGFCMKDNMKVW